MSLPKDLPPARSCTGGPSSGATGRTLKVAGRAAARSVPSIHGWLRRPLLHLAAEGLVLRLPALADGGGRAMTLQTLGLERGVSLEGGPDVFEQVDDEADRVLGLPVELDAAA